MNSTVKYTPYKWKVSVMLNGIPFIEDENGDIIALLSDEDGIFAGRYKTETEANAKLIAAAPELLEALVELMKFHYHVSENGIETYDANNKAHRAALVKCNEAIKKAT